MEANAAKTLPPGAGSEWTAMSYQEKIVGNQMYLVFAMALILVYLVLAGQYESWYAPGAVILSVPLALTGPVLVLEWLRIDNNLYTQIGIILLIALSAKNAILIVEVARERRVHEGEPLSDAAVDAAIARLRPILMTSFAFILGVAPLVVASGAGASARKSIGITVFSGMIASTCLAVLFVPSLFVVVQRFEEWRASRKAPRAQPAEQTALKGKRPRSGRARAAKSQFGRRLRYGSGGTLTEKSMPMIRLASLLAVACMLSINAAQAQISNAELLTRIDRLEAALRDLTGTVEQLQYRNQQFEQQLQRLQASGGAPAAVPPRPTAQTVPPPPPYSPPPPAQYSPPPGPIIAAPPAAAPAEPRCRDRPSRRRFQPRAQPGRARRAATARHQHERDRTAAAGGRAAGRRAFAAAGRRPARPRHAFRFAGERRARWRLAAATAG